MFFLHAYYSGFFVIVYLSCGAAVYFLSLLSDNRCMKGYLLYIILLLNPFLIFAEGLFIEQGEVYVEFDSRETEGFHIWIKANETMNSVLLTESSKDPEGLADSFALRAYEWNPVNGDEKRILDGEFLDSSKELYFIMDSTKEYNEEFGAEAFHLFVPLHMTYGYSWSREGQLEMSQGTWINLRTFSEPYADYRGSFKDNPFILDMKELPPPPEPAMIMEETEQVMAAMALNTDGAFSPVEDTEEAVERIAELIDQFHGGTIDVALVIDTTVSMKDDVDFIRRKLVPIVQSRVADFDSFRIGLVLYRDYKEAYLTREEDFTVNMETVQLWLDRISVNGGRDKREAVYEGLYSALSNLLWQNEHRLIIQVGDALPHEEPRGVITEEMVFDEAALKGVSIFPILLPED